MGNTFSQNKSYPPCIFFKPPIRHKELINSEENHEHLSEFIRDHPKEGLLLWNRKYHPDRYIEDTVSRSWSRHCEIDNDPDYLYKKWCCDNIPSNLRTKNKVIFS